LSDGSASDQSNRNHNAVRFNGQLEYSPIPDLTVFAQGLYAHFDYYQLTSPSLATSNFSSVRGLAGLRWELQGSPASPWRAGMPGAISPVWASPRSGGRVSRGASNCSLPRSRP
jgi:hypothetical protein